MIPITQAWKYLWLTKAGLQIKGHDFSNARTLGPFKLYF